MDMQRDNGIPHTALIDVVASNAALLLAAYLPVCDN
jgi:hypothetical protein